jgi:Fe-S-cluster containining protein
MDSKESLDCTHFVPGQCQAYCCGPVPVSKEVYQKNLARRCRMVVKEIEVGDGMIFPDTGTKQCVFLSQDLQCQIYEDRPKTCNEFGKIDSPLMQCPFMNKHGHKRSPEDRTRVEQEFKKAFDDLMGKGKSPI